MPAPVIPALTGVIATILKPLLTFFTWLARLFIPTATLSIGNLLRYAFLYKLFKVFTGLGFGWVTYELVNFGVDEIYIELQRLKWYLPADLVGILAMFGLFEAISILLTASSIALAIKGYDRATRTFSVFGRG